MLLVTGHRRESVGGGFERICQALRVLAYRHQNLQVVFPVHLNPNVREPVLFMRDSTERPEAVKAGTVKPVKLSASISRVSDTENSLLTDTKNPAY